MPQAIQGFSMIKHLLQIYYHVKHKSFKSAKPIPLTEKKKKTAAFSINFSIMAACQ